MLKKIFSFPKTGQDTQSKSDLLRLCIQVTLFTVVLVILLSALSSLICLFFPALRPNYGYTRQYSFAVMLLCVTVLPAIYEELIFRKLILDFLRKRFSDVTAALLSSFIFAVAHMSVVQGITAFIFGAFLAILAIRRRSIVLCIYAHLLNNLIFLLCGIPWN